MKLKILKEKSLGRFVGELTAPTKHGTPWSMVFDDEHLLAKVKKDGQLMAVTMVRHHTPEFRGQISNFHAHVKGDKGFVDQTFSYLLQQSYHFLREYFL